MVKSADRALHLVNLLTTFEKPMSWGQLLEEMDVPRSSLHALISSLTESGWVVRNEQHHTYQLGIRALEAGFAYSRSLSSLDRIRPFAEAVRNQLHETVQVSVLDGRYNVYVAKYDGGQALSLISEVGRRLPAHATGLGKMLLSDLRPAEFDATFRGVKLEKFTANTITDVHELREHVAEVRTLGYAIDREERTEGVYCVAVPIFDSTQRVFAALSLSAPLFRFGAASKKSALRLLLDASRRLSREFGARGQS